MMQGPVLQTISSLQELQTFRGIWKSWPGSRDSDPDFFSHTIRSRRASIPHVIVATRNATADAILVGRRERRTLSFRLGCFTIWQPEINVLEFVPGGPRGSLSNENCAALVRHVMGSMDSGDIDMAVWEQLDPTSAFYKHLLQWPRFVCRDYFPYIDDHRWITHVPNSLDAFLMTRSRIQRSKLRRKYNNILDRFTGKLEVRCVRSVAELKPVIADMDEIASKTKRRVVGQGFVATPEVREEMIAAAERGWLRIYVLYLDEKPAAFWRGIAYDGCLQGDHVGYDPVWSEFSPGIFLFLNILNSAHNDGIETIDLGFGDTQFKRSLGNVHCIESRLRIYSPTWHGIWLNLLNMLCPRANDCARFLLQGARCLEWARRASHGRLAHQRQRDDRSTISTQLSPTLHEQARVGLSSSPSNPPVQTDAANSDIVVTDVSCKRGYLSHHER